ncbi:thymidine phosphorylase family protein [Neptuniibacter caesariensis]|uniref:Putative thymidine phosphorylase n=1 Tax=Neptuniibacter caesariensis TaxID=207954 RepID=A0A7U8C9C2_NEPCE|nr:thymidine phosphorylase family protein [Neptuniibacter caesariensis]EAR62271.1 putative thymidine phosphorylase [Oceanospirillum sp. MED92] [Neptuniibacter caesariensis]
MSYTPERMTPLNACRLGLDTHQEPTIYLRQDSPVCRSEGFSALSRVLVRTEQRHLIATLHMVTGELLMPGEIGFSESAWKRLELREGTSVWLSHPKPVQSLSYIRSKVYGNELSQSELKEIIEDIVAGRYADVHLAAFITACGDDKLNIREITDLTTAMVESGSSIEWGLPIVVDKHCVGGLPGNRTTPILVSILTAAGLTMPKTSSRAITSPAGTADTMETLTNVSLSLDQMRTVVEQEGGCLAWGGSVKLSPSDDLLIQVERALDIDSEGQLIASVLSKKIAAGATHVVIDIPVGPTAKVRSQEAAEVLAANFKTVADTLGLKITTLFTDGSQPVGRGIGPSLEARDILAVLKQDPDMPKDLYQRASEVAGAVLEMVQGLGPGEGYKKAIEILNSGAAWEKFQAICHAQGAFKRPPIAPYRYELVAKTRGVVSCINNRKLAKVAKLAGAPADLAAGLDLHCKIGDPIEPQQTLLTIHAESSGELSYAVEYLEDHLDIIELAKDK